jgi:hypothetical protein
MVTLPGRYIKNQYTHPTWVYTIILAPYSSKVLVLKPIARPDGYESTQYQYRPGMGKGGKKNPYIFSPIEGLAGLFKSLYQTNLGKCVSSATSLLLGPEEDRHIISTIEIHHVLKTLVHLRKWTKTAYSFPSSSSSSCQCS